MKINIFFPFTKGSYGGGNQFLKALKIFFKEQYVYEESPIKADIILFNSHHNILELIRLKRKYPKKIFIHRIDGPIFLIRKDNMVLDKLIYNFNDKIADASIFQSAWSMQENYKLGIKKQQYETTILNAPDFKIFNKIGKSNFNPNKKIKIIATSWAANKSKGFDTYKYLDENLDFSKYEMTFCGNSPYQFKNIKIIAPLPSSELALILKQHDFFITASKNDPCSNALIEALHCGLPAIGYNDGGHPEIINKAGLIYNTNNELIECIEKGKNNYTHFQNNIKLPSINDTGMLYLNFIQEIYAKTKKTKKLSLYNSIILRKDIFVHKGIVFLRK